MNKKLKSVVLALFLSAGVESIENISHARTVRNNRWRMERRLNGSPKPPNQSIHQIPRTYSNDQSAFKDKIYTNNKSFDDSNNLDTRLRDLFGIDGYPEKRTLSDSIQTSLEYERLRRKMLAH